MLKLIRPAISLLLVFTIGTGLLFPFAITGISQVLFPKQAKGSLIVKGGQVVGSSLIGQSFTKPEYFHSRPSAAGNGYDGANSSGTNLGPTSDKLMNGIHKKLPDGKDDPGNFDGIADFAKAYRDENGLATDAQIPPDAVTRSASGLDPHISPANAELQVARVAKARGISTEKVQSLMNANTDRRTLGVIGEDGVNVLKLNLALDGN